jgi:hypothetical protein
MSQTANDFSIFVGPNDWQMIDEVQRPSSAGTSLTFLRFT